MTGSGRKSLRLSRRAFLVGSGGIAVAIGAGAYATTSGPPPLDGQVINAWLSIKENGEVQFVCPAQELGQGATTVLAMIIAEEMGAELAQVSVIAAPRDSATYGNPGFRGRMVTADSKTTLGYFDKLRFAGAQARLALIETAAVLRGWKSKDCTTNKHFVHHGSTGDKIGFDEVARSQTLHIPGSPDKMHLKPRSQYKLIGTSPTSADHHAIVTGKMKFGVDRRSKDSLVAVLSRSPHLGGKPLKVDDAQTRKLAEVVEIVILEDAVAVLATNIWSAIKGRDLLNVSWTEADAFDNASERAALAAKLKANNGASGIIRSSGTPQKVSGNAVLRFTETFYSPPITHVALEPLNAQAQGRAWGLGVSVVSSTQSLDLDMRYSAKTWKTAPFMVKNRSTRCGGAHGRRVLNDVVRDAVAISKIVGKPVQVIRPLSDELQRGQVRPAALQKVEVTADNDGNLISWVHRVASDSVLTHHLPESLERLNGIDNTATDGLLHRYRVPHETIGWHYVPSRPVPGFLRGVSAGYTVWAIETMVDRIARASNRDPLAWRLAHLDNRRAVKVLEKVAEISGWETSVKAGKAFGLAQMTFRGSSVATVAEVFRGDNGLNVRKIWIAADVGLAIHPENVIGQIEGAALLGISLAIKEQLTFKQGAAEINDLSDYPVLKADEVPDIKVTLVGAETATRPNGVGEIGVPTIAPAIGNALAVIKGVHPSALPIELSAL